jgi:microcystin-dependent protein
MTAPYLGEIRMFGGTFAPRGNALCNGQLLPINQDQALFALLGTIYGGDGQSTFALPNLMGRVPIHWGQGIGLSDYPIGTVGGVESVTLSQQEMPNHGHALLANSQGGTAGAPAANSFLAASTARDRIYAATNDNTALALGLAGGSQPHENRQPFLAITFIIALQGIFPSRN